MKLEEYKGFRIVKVENAPMNRTFKTEILYSGTKLDFSQLYNYIDLMGTTLERLKENIDYYTKFNNQKFTM